MKFRPKEDIKRLLIITLAAILLAFVIKIFVHTGDLFPGGITGVTILLQRIAKTYLSIDLPYSVVYLLFSAFPVYMGFRYIGKKTTLFSIYMMVLSAVLTDLLPAIPITYDTLLISIFGGMLTGASVSLCLLMGANSGGTDFISIYLSEKKGIDGFQVILIANAVILVAAGLLFGWDRALYSILFQYFSAQIVHLLYRRYQQMTILTVTDHPTEVCHAISTISNHSATVLRGEGAHDRSDRYLVYSVVSSAEYKKVMKTIKMIDPHAFINSVKTETLRGTFYRQPNE